MRTTTVGEVMTRDVVTAQEDTPFKEIAKAMHDSRVSGLPIVDGQGRLRGIVSEADLLRFESDDQDGRQPRSFVAWFLDPSRRPAAEAIDGVRARDVMTANVVTVGPDTSIREASKMLLDAGVKRLPVVDDAMRVVGIVSRSDLLSPLLRSDEDIAREVREDVILDALWIDPTMIRATVTDGVVHLEGRVDRRSVRDILVEMVQRVDGVIGIGADDLEFERDDRDIKPQPARSELRWGENWVRQR